MDNSVTFILGAGFSVPAGFPTAKKLGEQIINSGNMPIAFRNGKLCFRNDGTKPDFGFNDPTEEAFQFGLRLINYYNSKYSSFQYEDFYDYLMQLHLCAGDNKETIDSNIIKLLSISYSTNNERSNLYQQTYRFIGVYEELIAYLLGDKKTVDTSSYEKFASYLESLVKKGYHVNVYTLNHDLLFEQIVKNYNLHNVYDDGFTLENSPYYTIVQGESLGFEYFANRYNKPINLHKLHGSVSYHMFSTELEVATYVNKDFVKTPKGYDEFNVYSRDSEGNIRRGLFGYNSEFLSGTKTKTTRYDNRIYYKPQFDHFEQDLNQTDELIIIGYGFGDAKINETLKKWLNTNAKCKIIDPYLAKEAEEKAIDILNTPQLIKESIDKMTWNE